MARRGKDGLTADERRVVKKAAAECPTKQFLASWLMGYFGHVGGEPERVRQWKEEKLIDQWFKEAHEHERKVSV